MGEVMKDTVSQSQPCGAPKSATSGSEPSASYTPVGLILEGDDWEPGDIAFILNGPVGRGYTIRDLWVAAAAPDLLEAAQTVLAGLHARIDAARDETPVFAGIAALHGAIAKALGAPTASPAIGSSDRLDEPKSSPPPRMTREAVAEAIARDLYRQEHGSDRDGPIFSQEGFSWPYIDQGEVNFGEIADRIIALAEPLGEGGEGDMASVSKSGNALHGASSGAEPSGQ